MTPDLAYARALDRWRAQARQILAAPAAYTARQVELATRFLQQH